MQNKTKKKQALKNVGYIHSYAKTCIQSQIYKTFIHSHTNITNLKLNIRHYIIKKRATAFFLSFTFPLYYLSPTHKRKNIKTKKQVSKSLSLQFAKCVRVTPELSQCSGKLSIGTHDSTHTGSYHKSPLCKKIKINT